MEILRLGDATVELHDDGLTVTRLPAGEVHARPHDTEEYRARAKALGYGDDADLLSREHELTHAMLALWLGLWGSPTFDSLAKQGRDKHWRIEEAAVLAIQAFARAKGISLVALARIYSFPPPL